MRISFALSEGESCVCGITVEQREPFLRPENGDCADLLEHLYGTLRGIRWPEERSEQPAMLAEAFQIAWDKFDTDREGYTDISRWETMSLQEAERMVRRDGAMLTFRYELPGGDLSVSKGAKLTGMDLVLPKELDPELVHNLFHYAKPIGFALGTPEEGWTRRFVDPWRKLAECLADRNPVEALQKAAAGDVLAELPSLMTRNQLPSQDFSLKFSDKSMEEFFLDLLIGFRVPGGLVKTLYCTMEKGGGIRFQNLALWGDHCYLRRENLTAMPAKRRWCGTSKLLSKIKESPDAKRKFGKLAWLLYLARGLGALCKYEATEVQALLLWYMKGTISEYADSEPVLPKELFTLTWGEVRTWLDEFRQQAGMYLDPEYKKGEYILRIIKDKENPQKETWAPYYGTDLYEDIYNILLDRLQTVREGDVDGWTGVYKALKPLAGTCGLPGQTGYMLLPHSIGTVKYGTLEPTANGFCLAAGEEELDISDILSQGGRIRFSVSGIGEQAKELGRKMVRLETAMRLPQALEMRMNDRDRQIYSRVEDRAKARISPIWDCIGALTVPADWAYTYAVFQDGQCGIAYGPMEGQENEEEAKVRLFRQARDLTSENALIIFP